MKQHRQLVVRVAVGLVLLVVAAGVSYLIRDMLASRNPRSALPVMAVKYLDGNTEIPQENCLLASYSWRFVNHMNPKEGALQDPGAWRDLAPCPVEPGAPLAVEFSFPCKSLKVSRWHDLREDDAEVLTEPFTTPFSGGTYTYRIEANWDARGSVQYYVRVKVTV